MEFIEYIVIILLGLIFGSFASVLVFRLPYGGSIITPMRSECPNCANGIKFYHNIPIISYLILRGKCNSCNVKIPIIYLILEIITPLLFIIVYYEHRGLGINDQIFYITVTYLLILISFTDIVTSLDEKFKSGIIPEIYLIILILLPLSYAGFIEQDYGKFVNMLTGFATSFLLLYLLSAIFRVFLKKDSIGDGDIILFGAITMCLKNIDNIASVVMSIAIILIVSSVTGILIWLIMRLNFKKRGLSIKEIRIPFAPALAAGYLFLIIF